MPNAHSLAMRDPAMAALVGATKGSSFGIERNRSSSFARLVEAEFGEEFAGDHEMGDDVGFEDPYMHGDFGDELHGDFGADVAIPKPTAPQAVALWKQHHRKKARGQQRARLLNPNSGSAMKVEQYIFPLLQNVVLGVPAVLNITNQPDCTLRPQRVVMNSPVPGFATISEIRVANIAVSIGGGTAFDSFFFNAGGVGVRLDMPTLTPANRATILGNTTVLVPLGYPPAMAYSFAVSFIGPAQMAG